MVEASAPPLVDSEQLLPPLVASVLLPLLQVDLAHSPLQEALALLPNLVGSEQPPPPLVASALRQAGSALLPSLEGSEQLPRLQVVLVQQQGASEQPQPPVASVLHRLRVALGPPLPPPQEDSVLRHLRSPLALLLVPRVVLVPPEALLLGALGPWAGLQPNPQEASAPRAQPSQGQREASAPQAALLEAVQALLEASVLLPLQHLVADSDRHSVALVVPPQVVSAPAPLQAALALLPVASVEAWGASERPLPLPRVLLALARCPRSPWAVGREQEQEQE